MAGVMPLKLPRLRTDISIADSSGNPTREFSRFWDEHCTLLEESYLSLILAISALSALSAQAAELQERVQELEVALSQREEIPERRLTDILLLAGSRNA